MLTCKKLENYIIEVSKRPVVVSRNAYGVLVLDLITDKAYFYHNKLNSFSESEWLSMFKKSIQGEEYAG